MGGLEPGLTALNKGDQLPATHPIVQANPQDFEKV
jgi:hypothetical protein